MPKLITEADVFPDPHTITVPEGTDSKIDAAEVVEALTQKLGNRTWFLKQRALRKDVFNAMAGDVVSGFEFQSPAEATLTWRSIIRCLLGPDGYTDGMITVYSGGTDNGAAGQFAIVYNAENTPGTATWEQTRSDRKSWAFMLGHNAAAAPFVFASKAAGAPPWTTWDVDVSLGGLNVNLPAADIAYLPSRNRVTVMGSGTARAGGHDGGNGSLLTDGSLGHAFVDLRFPPNWDASGASIEVVHYQATTAPATVRLVERVVNFASPAAATQTTLVSDVGPASTGYKKRSLSLSGVTFDQAGKEYRLVWIPGNVADTFEGWRVLDWKDSGPRNTLA